MTTPFAPDPSDTIETQMLKALRHAEEEGVEITAFHLTAEDFSAFNDGLPKERFPLTEGDRESFEARKCDALFHDVPVYRSTWTGYTTETMGFSLWRGEVRAHLDPPYALDAWRKYWRDRWKDVAEHAVPDLTAYGEVQIAVAKAAIDPPLVVKDIDLPSNFDPRAGGIAWVGEEPKPAPPSVDEKPKGLCVRKVMVHEMPFLEIRGDDTPFKEWLAIEEIVRIVEDNSRVEIQTSAGYISQIPWGDAQKLVDFLDDIDRDSWTNIERDDQT